MKKLPVYIFNTETTKEKVYHSCKTFFFLSSGFKDLLVLSQLNINNIDIIYYDFNIDALNFKRWLFTDWDGSKVSLSRKIEMREYLYCLPDLYYKNKKDFNKLSLTEQFYHGWKIEIQKWKNENSFQQAFKKVKNHKNKKFIRLDIAKDFKIISSLINNYKDPIYFWYSNCFDYEHNKTSSTQKMKFLSSVEKTGKTVYCVTN